MIMELETSLELETVSLEVISIIEVEEENIICLEMTMELEISVELGSLSLELN